MSDYIESARKHLQEWQKSIDSETFTAQMNEISEAKQAKEISRLANWRVSDDSDNA